MSNDELLSFYGTKSPLPKSQIVDRCSLFKKILEHIKKAAFISSKIVIAAQNISLSKLIKLILFASV